ncbi:MAG: GyrI-like domain-containing protein [Maritimibacter sp.]|nr:GyrI-like domain-containing protein [Maritimibacter sp.]
MEKLDFKTRDRAFYTGKPGQWQALTLPEMTFLAIEGEGDPNGPGYAAALSALYPLAYGVKFACKAAGADFTVPSLEALWWADDPAAFTAGDRAAWRWRAMLRVPDDVTTQALDEARATARAKGKTGPLDSVTRLRLTEGDCLQTLHLGPYSDEAPVLARLHDEIMPAEDLDFAGPHHEIYLSDPRRTAPEKLRTILRQPVRATLSPA